MEKYSATRGQAEVYRIVLSDRSGWADISVEEYYNGGTIKVLSDCGNFCYAWTNIGDISFKEFLSQINFDYFMEKTYGPDFIEVDVQATLEEVEQDILSLRRGKELNRREARLFYDYIRRPLSRKADARTIINAFKTSGFIENLYGKYMKAEPPIIYKYNEHCLAFWELIWPCFLNLLRREIKQGELVVVE